MNDVNAAIGIENLKIVDKEVIQKHKDNAAYYDNHLKWVGSPMQSLLSKPDRDPRMESAFWIYSLLVERKDDFMRYMKECGIAVSQVHERNDIHSCVEKFQTQLPSLDWVKDRLVNIPVGWWVTKEDRQYIVECIKKGW